MSSKLGLKNRKLLSSNWFVTLTATLLGVFVALYLNEWVANRKLLNKKSKVTKNLLAEISSNHEKLKKATERHIEILDILEFLESYSDEEGNLIVGTDSMSSFRLRNPDFILLVDSTLVSEGIYKYHGEINFNLSLPYLEITTLAWNTLKNSDVISTYDFECLMYLEGVNNITDEVLAKNKQVFDYFIGIDENREILIRNLSILIDFEKSLGEIYTQSEEILKSCS